MEKVLIGSSNVYRFYRPDNFKDYNVYNMVRCTDMVTFKAIVNNLEANETEVVISVIENFIERAVGQSKSDEEIWTKSGDVLASFVGIIGEAAKRLPGTKFALADPIIRPKLNWYQRTYDDLQAAFVESIGSLKRNNVTRFEAIAQGCSQFEGDQTHLTAESGQIFIDGLLTKAETFFKAPVIDLVEDEEEVSALSATDLLALRLDKLENQVTSRQTKDNLIFARLREEMDFATNKQKEDRIVVTGLTSSVPPPTDPAAKKLWIRKIVEDIFKKISPDFAGVIHYINQGKSNGRMIPLVEVKLDSAANALILRKAFADKRKNGEDLGRIFISNSVNLATRVRVDVLKVLARKISDLNVVANAVPFVSRPVLQVRPKESAASGNNETRTYTYTDAISKYGHLLKQFELGEAYRRAGTSFKGQLEQQFVVLREQGQVSHQHQQQPQQRQQQQQGWGSRYGGDAGTSRKRTRDDDDDEHLFEPPGGRGGRHAGATSGNRRPFRGNKYSRK
jgi:hypothetical protein